MAMPAEPAPFTTTRHSSLVFPVTFKPLIIPASTTIAVPCWSSWKIGISQHSFSFFSISKHLGAEISSRFTPPKLPARRRTVCTISSTSLLRTQSGTALTPPKDLKRTALPSITGIAACAPIFPSPRTALPSETTAIVLAFIVYLYAASLSFAITLQGSATPGVYARARSSLVEISIFGVVSNFPFHFSCKASAFSAFVMVESILSKKHI